MEQIQQKKSNKKRIIIFSVVALVLAWFAVQFYHLLTYEETDNAQIEGDIVPIRTSVPGYISTVNFIDNQPVRKGQVLILIDDRDLRAKVLQAEAALENAKAARLQTGSNIAASATSVNATQFSAEAIQQNIEVAKARLWKATADYARVKNWSTCKALPLSKWMPPKPNGAWPSPSWNWRKSNFSRRKNKPAFLPSRHKA
ncbi:HlyD family secretion protein [Puia sp. P3]|uniref:HlyD family secretion protein n=1 Tax=Puia sp. P3 TaxID=3423952 RepID=UPI003D67E764